MSKVPLHFMGKLKSHGGFDDELLAQVKAQLSENLDFSEQQEPPARNKAGMPSTKGFIDTHFNFGDGTAPFEYSTCQRADGSYYGTGGTCRKGSPVAGGVPDSGSKSSSGGGGGGGSSSSKSKSGGEFRTRPKGAIESDMKKLTSSGAMNQKGTAGVKAREEHAKLKAELKKPLEGSKQKNGGEVKPKKGRWDDFNKKSKKIEDDLRKKYAGKTPKGKGGMTEDGMRRASGKLD